MATVKRIESFHVYRAVRTFNYAVIWYREEAPDLPALNGLITKLPLGKALMAWFGIVTDDGLYYFDTWMCRTVPASELPTMRDGVQLLRSYTIIPRYPGTMCYFPVTCPDGTRGTEERSVWLKLRPGTSPIQDHPPIDATAKKAHTTSIKQQPLF